MNWDDAHCHPDRRPESISPDAWTGRWFPPQPKGRPTPERIAEWEASVASACGNCPLKSPCGEFGQGQHHGIWGGKWMGRHYPSSSGAAPDTAQCLWCRELFIPLRAGGAVGFCSDGCRRHYDLSRKRTGEAA